MGLAIYTFTSGGWPGGRVAGCLGGWINVEVEDELANKSHEEEL